MKRRGRRGWRAVLLVGQLAAAVLVPLADARTVAGSVEPDARGDAERPAHVHDHCAFCLHLAHRGDIPPAGASFGPATTEVVAESWSAPESPAIVWRAQPRGRSPPTV